MIFQSFPNLELEIGRTPSGLSDVKARSQSLPKTSPSLGALHLHHLRSHLQQIRSSLGPGNEPRTCKLSPQNAFVQLNLIFYDTFLQLKNVSAQNSKKLSVQSLLCVFSSSIKLSIILIKLWYKIKKGWLKKLQVLRYLSYFFFPFCQRFPTYYVHYKKIPYYAITSRLHCLATSGNF